MRVPLLDLRAQHAPLRGEIDAAIARVVDSGGFIGGTEVESFETEFAAWLGAGHCVGVSSGTSALVLGLRACGIRPGDEVVTSAMSFVATAAAILQVGAVPVLVDPDPHTGLIEPETAAEAITTRTTALLPVHLYGQAVDLRGFRALADEHGLALIEDACQAHGARRDGLAAGAVGDVAAFSFYPGKNLGALGDGGALTTHDATIADRVRRLRDHGRVDRYVHAEVGETARLDAIQAAVLRVKLPHLTAWNEGRRANADAYESLLQVDRIHQEGSVFHQYVVLSEDRDALAARLAEEGIGTGVHYALPLHRQPALVGRVRCVGELDGAERIAARCLSIPVYPELSHDELRRVAATVAELRSEEVSTR